jgi:hypothetical protein
MASATFGQRNAIQPAKSIRSPKPAVAGRSDAERGTPQAEPPAADAGHAIDQQNARKVFVGALALLLIAVVLPVVFFSELYRDMGLRDSFRPDLNVRVERASCSRYFLLVTSCNVQLSWPDGDGRTMADSSFLVGFKSMGGLRVVPLRSSADPAVLTSSVALEHLGNRTWTLALISGICVLLGVLMLRKVSRSRA